MAEQTQVPPIQNARLANEPDGAIIVVMPRYRLSESVMTRELGADLVMLELGNGVYYALNTTGRSMLELLLNGADDDAIVRTMLERFDTDAPEIREDLHKLVAELLEKRILIESD